MSKDTSNPFNPTAHTQDGFDFLKRMWGGGMSLPGMMTPTTDLNELQKRITDLKAVEQWLNLNLTMLRASIQGLEVQHNTLAALQAFGNLPAQENIATQAIEEASTSMVNTATAWWNLMQDQFANAAQTAQQTTQSAPNKMNTGNVATDTPPSQAKSKSTKPNKPKQKTSTPKSSRAGQSNHDV